MSTITVENLHQIENADTSKMSHPDVYSGLKKDIGIITEGFTDPSQLSDEKVDMTDKIKEEGYTEAEYIKKFGSVMRSEVDVTKGFLQELGVKAGGSSAKSDSDDIALKKRKARARANAAKAKIAIEKEKLKMK